MFGSDRDLTGTRAPEFPAGLTWLNSRPLSMLELKGKIVMIDFWTYSCVNCARTLPHIKEWHEKYAGKGLVIIGVHTPEFEFEKDVENVKRAIEENEIKYPNVLDPNFQVWQLYANHWWPRKLLVDQEGKIRYDHIGEGGYEETETQIQKMLGALGEDLKSIPIAKYEAKGGGVCFPMTAETYCGYQRGLNGNPDGFRKDKVSDYVDEIKDHKDGYLYLSGQWLASAEFTKYEGKPMGGQLLLKYHALEVNAVLKPEVNSSFKFWIKKDGKNLTDDDKGKDVMLDSQGNSYVIVNKPKMYNLIWEEEGKFGTHELTLVPDSDAFSIYAFTFGACLS